MLNDVTMILVYLCTSDKLLT